MIRLYKIHVVFVFGPSFAHASAEAPRSWTLGVRSHAAAAPPVRSSTLERDHIGLAPRRRWRHRLGCKQSGGAGRDLQFHSFRFERLTCTDSALGSSTISPMPGAWQATRSRRRTIGRKVRMRDSAPCTSTTCKRTT